MKKKPSTKPVKAPPTHASAVSSTRVTQQSVDETATALRRELAEAVRSQYLRKFDREAAATRISKSPFAQYVTDFPATDAVKLLDFNLSLTEAAVEHLLERCDEPEQLLFTASRAAEQGMYQLYDPEGSRNAIQFLGASKDLGYFFTPPEVATLMARRLIGSGEPIQRLLDPAAGMGSLLGAVAIQASLARVPIKEILAIEFDPHTAKTLQRILNRLRDLLSASWSVSVVNDDALLYAIAGRDVRAFVWKTGSKTVGTHHRPRESRRGGAVLCIGSCRDLPVTRSIIAKASILAREPLWHAQKRSLVVSACRQRPLVRVD